jgi:hypothetical protein
LEPKTGDDNEDELRGPGAGAFVGADVVKVVVADVAGLGNDDEDDGRVDGVNDGILVRAFGVEDAEDDKVFATMGV